MGKLFQKLIVLCLLCAVLLGMAHAASAQEPPAAQEAREPQPSAAEPVQEERVFSIREVIIVAGVAVAACLLSAGTVKGRKK